MSITFKEYLVTIGAEIGDKLEFVKYSNPSHSHWGFHSEDCIYSDFYVGEDGCMHCTVAGSDLRIHTNWGFIFRVVPTKFKAGMKFKDYFAMEGFKDGDELEFVGYVTGDHDHWAFEEGAHTFKVAGDNLALMENGHRSFELVKNYDFIFKRKLPQHIEEKIKALKMAVEVLENEIEFLQTYQSTEYKL